MTRLAFLGTGLMGAALAEAAARRGDAVTVWNRKRAKAEPLAAFGARVADTPAQAIEGAERVHIMLSDDAAVDQVLDASGAALAGPLVIDHTTASPAGTAARAARLEAKGVAWLHAPVFMSPAMCRAATGVMLVSGAKETFERAAPGLRAMTGTVDYAGERRDLAAAFKLFGNAMILTITAGLADVFALGKALGLPAGDVYSLFGKFNPAGTITYRGAAMAKGDYKASFELSMARKDARLMLEAAKGETLTVLPAIAKRMDELLARGLQADDVGILAIDAVPKS